MGKEINEQIAITFSLFHMIAANKINETNTIVFLKEILKRLDNDLPNTYDDEDKINCAVQFLTEISKGNDGILGTKDDIISLNVLHDIQTMTNTNIIYDIVSLCKDVVNKGEINPTKLSLCCLKLT